MKLSVKLRYWWCRLKQILGMQKYICWVGTEAEYEELPLSVKQRKTIVFFIVDDGIKINEELNKININK